MTRRRHRFLSLGEKHKLICDRFLSGNEQTREIPSVHATIPRIWLCSGHNCRPSVAMIATNSESANHRDSSRMHSPDPISIQRCETRLSMSDESSNLLLASLSPKYRAALLSRMRTVALPAREVMYEPDETPKFAHFLTGGIASIVGTMSAARALKWVFGERRESWSVSTCWATPGYRRAASCR